MYHITKTNSEEKGVEKFHNYCVSTHCGTKKNLGINDTEIFLRIVFIII